MRDPKRFDLIFLPGIDDDDPGDDLTRGDLVCRALRAGLTRVAAAKLAMISRGTLYRWIEEDGEFRAEVDQAEAMGQMHHAMRLNRPERMPPSHVAASVAAAKFFLSTRTESDAWVQRSAVKHDGAMTVADAAREAAAKASVVQSIDEAMTSGDDEPIG